MKNVPWVHLGIALLGVVFLIVNEMKYRAKKKSADKIHCRWSSKFNLGIPANRIRWVLLIIAMAGIVYLILSEPQARGNYSVVVGGILVFSQYPRWNVLVGSKGIVMGTRFISWEKMVEKEIKEYGKNKHLELTIAPESDPAKTQLIKIQIPCGKCDNIASVLKAD